MKNQFLGKTVITSIVIFLLPFFTTSYGQTTVVTPKTEHTIFAFGGDIQPKFIQYVIDLTHKSNPKICYVPTASADNKNNIDYWHKICKQLSIEPYVLPVWVDSYDGTKAFDETLLSMDAIVVGGGNTLNMLGIWKEQGIDTVLRMALQKGIVLAGGSAGSLCWFQNGVSDSRPTHLSIIKGLNFLPYSNCPHVADTLKRALYYDKIMAGEIGAGYACDDFSAILFKNGTFVEAVSSKNETNNSYYVTKHNNAIVVEKLPIAKVLVNKNAIAETDYKTINVDKKVADYKTINSQDTPLNAFVHLVQQLSVGKMSKLQELSSPATRKKIPDNLEDKPISEANQSKMLNKTICKVLIYNDTTAAVINKSVGYYGVWFFYKENGKWLNAGEFMGGDTVLESEIIFREQVAGVEAANKAL